MKSGGEAVTVSHDQAVALLTFQGSKDGAVSNRGAAQLVNALAALMDDGGVRAIVLKGGDAGQFIRHADIGQIARAADALEKGDISEEAFLSSPFQQLCAALDRATKPVIAAIDGACMGGGLEIALACTMRIASGHVRHIGLPEIRIGIPPGAGGPQRLARLIGAHRARLFVLDGRIVDATEAAKLGVVDMVVDDAVSAAIERAEGFAKRPSHLVAEILRQMIPDDDAALEKNLRGFARSLLVPGTADHLAEVDQSGRQLEDFS